MTESKSAPEGVVLRLLIPSRFQFQVALVMTDGKQTVDEEEVLSADILYNAVQPLKDKNVKVLSLGIGKNTNLFDLWTLASSGSDVFLAENFEQLKDLVTDLTQNKCPGKKTCKKRNVKEFLLVYNIILERSQKETSSNKGLFFYCIDTINHVV